MVKHIKEEKGIMVSDAIVSTLIILVLTGTILSLMYNIVIETSKSKVNSQQLDLAIEVFEYIEKISYDNVTEQNLVEYLNMKNPENIGATALNEEFQNIDKPCKILITISPYNATEENNDKYDFIKTITIKIENKINDKIYNTEMSRIKKATISEANQIILRKQEEDNS